MQNRHATHSTLLHMLKRKRNDAAIKQSTRGSAHAYARGSSQNG